MFAFLLAAVDTRPSKEVLELELEAFLHGGRWGEVDGMRVMKGNGVDPEEYAAFLKREKDEQDFAYLSELGIKGVTIGPSGVPCSITTETYNNAFRTNMLLKKFLSLRGESRLPDFVQTYVNWCAAATDPPTSLFRLWIFMSYLLDATFLLRRDALRSRFRIPETVPNRVRTLSEEMKLIESYKTDWASLSPPHTNPLKLTVAHDEPNVLHRAIEVWESNAATEARTSVYERPLALRTIFENQHETYSKFLYGAAKTYNFDTSPDIKVYMDSLKKLRSANLDMYKEFKIFFPSFEDCRFNIYLFDPERRAVGYPDSLDTADIWFPAKAQALHSANSRIIPSFGEVQVPYTGQLHDVVLLPSSGALNSAFGRGYVTGYTSGRLMILVDSGHDLVYALTVIRHECGHLLLSRAIAERFRDIPPADNALGLHIRQSARERLEPFHTLAGESVQDMLRPRNLAALRNLQTFLRRITFFRDHPNEVPERSALYLQAREHGFSTLLDELLLQIRAVFSNVRGVAYDATRLTDSASLPGHVSRYATQNDAEDVAEMLEKLQTAYKRPDLFVRCRTQDPTLCAKIDAIFEVFAKNHPAFEGETRVQYRERMEVVESWMKDRQHWDSRVARRVRAKGRATVAFWLNDDAQPVKLVLFIEREAHRLREDGYDVSTAQIFYDAQTGEIQHRYIHKSQSSLEPDNQVRVLRFVAEESQRVLDVYEQLRYQYVALGHTLDPADVPKAQRAQAMQFDAQRVAWSPTMCATDVKKVALRY